MFCFGCVREFARHTALEDMKCPNCRNPFDRVVVAVDNESTPATIVVESADDDEYEDTTSGDETESEEDEVTLAVQELGELVERLNARIGAVEDGMRRLNNAMRASARRTERRLVDILSEAVANAVSDSVEDAFRYRRSHRQRAR